MKKSERKILLWVYLGVIIGLYVLWLATSHYLPKTRAGEPWQPVSKVATAPRHAEGGQPMMRLARRATLLVAFSLLISAASAYADCAWVLWRMGESSPWHVFQAFSTREGCITAMHQQ